MGKSPGIISFPSHLNFISRVRSANVSGMPPEIALSCNSISTTPVNDPSSEGILPVIALPFSRRVNRLLNLPSDNGMDPTTPFCTTEMCSKKFKSPMTSGRTKSEPFKSGDNFVTRPSTHSTFGQTHTPTDPVGMLPRQDQLPLTPKPHCWARLHMATSCATSSALQLS
jgi:hypothetical protein